MSISETVESKARRETGYPLTQPDGGWMCGRTQESLQIYIKNTAVFLQAAIFC